MMAFIFPTENGERSPGYITLQTCVFPREALISVVIYRPGRLGRAKPLAGPEFSAGATSSFNRSPVISSGPEASICPRALAPNPPTVKGAANSYLLRDLESFPFGNRESIMPRAGVHHTLPDGRSGGARVNEEHDLRAGIVIQGIPRRSGGDVSSNGVRLNILLLVGQNDSLLTEIHSLHQIPNC